MKLMGDDDDGFPVSLHVAEDRKKLGGLLRSKNGRRFIQNQNIGSPVEHLHDLHRLFFRNGHIVDFFGGVQIKTISGRNLLHLG
ncbi:hypothetical protein SDC9_71765 [bioreactor metagenome]|uniref:Uncharacterized protein n=1 Tax=bioreactor metagenome TaxID=1076179 RepID=A0A644Y9Q1_9ZZZZ